MRNNAKFVAPNRRFTFEASENLLYFYGQNWIMFREISSEYNWFPYLLCDDQSSKHYKFDTTDSFITGNCN